jgi:hypothetical protein
MVNNIGFLGVAKKPLYNFSCVVREIHRVLFALEKYKNIEFSKSPSQWKYAIS